MKTKLYFGLILLALFFSTCTKTNAQSPDWLWAKAIGGIGGDVGWSIALDPAGNGDVYITGSFQETVDFNPGAGTFNLTSTGERDIFISKLDGSGDFVWAKAMGGTDGFGYGTSIAVDHEGSRDVYTTGWFRGTVDFDPGAGTFYLISAGIDDIFISKLDESGNFVWAKAMGGTGEDRGTSIALDALKHVHVAGSFYSPSISFGSTTLTNVNTTGGDIFIVKLDTAFTVSVVDVDSKTQQMNIYPNPATNELTIEFDGNEFFNVDITMFNILGEVVYSNQNEIFSHQKTIDISSLSTGIYFVELNVNGNRLAQKVVKE